MNLRIKKVRTDAKMSMKSFGNKVGVSPSTVALMESGERAATERTLRLICTEFHVNREWLETGKGEPYESGDKSADMAEAERVLRDMDLDENAVIRAMVLTWAQMTDAEKAVVSDALKKFAARLNGEDLTASIEDEIDRKTAEYRRQLELEARAVEKSEHSFESTEAI